MKQSESKTSKSKIPLISSVACLAILISSYFFVPDVQSFFNEAWDVFTSSDEERMEEWVGKFGWFGSVVLILTMVAQMFLVVIPSILLMVISVLVYGPIGGSLINIAAIFAASSIGYFVGKQLGRSIVFKLLGEKTEKKIEEFIENYSFWAIILSRLNPFLSNDAISFVGGILRMGYWRFIGATLVGILPLTSLIAILGEDINSLKTALLWGSLAGLIVFGVYVYLDKKKNNTSDKN